MLSALSRCDGVLCSDARRGWGGRGLVGMNFDDDKAAGKLEVRRAVVASVGGGRNGGWGNGGGFAGLDWICLCALFFFLPGAAES